MSSPRATTPHPLAVGAPSTWGAAPQHGTRATGALFVSTQATPTAEDARPAGHVAALSEVNLARARVAERHGSYYGTSGQRSG